MTQKSKQTRGWQELWWVRKSEDEKMIINNLKGIPVMFPSDTRIWGVLICRVRGNWYPRDQSVGLIRAKKNWLGWIRWAPVVSDLPSELTLDSSIQGPSAGNGDKLWPSVYSYLRTGNQHIDRPSRIWTDSQSLESNWPNQIFQTQDLMF